MSARTLRPVIHTSRSSPQPRIPLPRPTQLQALPRTRSFLTSGTSTPQTLTASRTLPYPPLAIYSIIADIPSYASFIPLCRAAQVTSWTRPDAHYQRRWPQRATLTIGYGDSIRESFTSRVLCAPPPVRAGVGYVEALSGRGVKEEVKRRLDGDEKGELAHHDIEEGGGGGVGDADVEGGPLQVLRTRWTVRGRAGDAGPGMTDERTDVALSIEFRFGNPFYDVMSRTVAPTLAEKMIEAFERRVRTVLDK